MFYPKNGYADEYNGASGQTYIFITDGTYYYGCGYNVQGNLGLVNTTSQSSWQAILTPDTGYAITKLWVGAQPQGTSFMQTSSGRLYACGLNSNGQLGIGNTTQQTSWVNVSYFGTTYTFTDIQSNGYNGTAFNSTTFLTSSGAFFTVGNGTYGQLGNGTTISITTPTQITFTGGLVIQKVIKAQLMVWIIFTNGTYTRWGFNVQGQLGNGTVTQQNSPVYSSSGDPGGATVTNIFATLPTGTNGNVVWQTFLLKPTGLYACGYNDAGCLGIGNNSLQATVSTQTLVNISNLNILDIKTTGTYNTATTSVMIFNNSCNVFGCGYNANYALNTSIVAQKNNFRNLNLLRSF
jgi:alpha-tubulin suppressor-like RCC1 family protein